MEQTKDIFGKRLFEIRESRRESQQELADSIGITRQSLSRYELGERTANIDLLKKIAEHYNISADYLLGLTDNLTTERDLKAACEYTGLNENAILWIKEYYINHSGDELYYYVLNNVLCSHSFYDIINRLITIHCCTKEYFYHTLRNYILMYIDRKNGTVYDFGRRIYTTLDIILKDIDVDRYMISKTVEEISDIFDKRKLAKELNNKELLSYSEFTKQDLQLDIENDIEMAKEKINIDFKTYADDKDFEVFAGTSRDLLLSSSEISKLIDEALEISENYFSMINKQIFEEVEAEENGEHNPSEE